MFRNSLRRSKANSEQELVLWNPSLAQGNNNGSSTNNYAYPCTISESVSYCVALESPTAGKRSPSSIRSQQNQIADKRGTAPVADTVAPPSPRAAGEIENCTAWFSPQDYHSCQDVLLTTWLEFDEFHFMNPSLKSDCTGLTVGTFYCVSIDKDGKPPTSLPIPTATATTTSTTATGTGITTPTPTQNGMAETCDEFYLVEKGDVCADIAKEHGIDRADFDAWNPAVKNDCTGLIAEYYVCVGVYAPPPTTTGGSPPTSTTGRPGSTPTPTQEGMVKGCNDFYMVKAGDGCYDIADAGGILLDNFYKWNPAVKDDCSRLLSGFYVCVGVE